MAGEIKLTAELREEFGKGAARRIRRADKVPAVLYGHGTDPVHITLPGHETLLALRQQNALLTIDIPGRPAQLALPKQIQRDPVKGFIEHVDLLLVRRGEKVTVEVPVVITGEPAPDTIAMLENAQVALEAEATHIPADIEVSVEGLAAGSQILAKDLALPTGSALAVDEELLIVNITVPRTAEEPTESAGDGEGESAAEGTADAEESTEG